MEILDFDQWPKSPMTAKAIHPLLEQALKELKTGSVLRFTEDDLVELPNKSLILLEQRLRTLAKTEGFRISVVHRIDTSGGKNQMYVRRNNAKRN